jgi:hypothetical protein
MRWQSFEDIHTSVIYKDDTIIVILPAIKLIIAKLIKYFDMILRSTLSMSGCLMKDSNIWLLIHKI